MQDEDFVAEKDDAGSPTDESGGEDADGSDDAEADSEVWFTTHHFGYKCGSLPDVQHSAVSSIPQFQFLEFFPHVHYRFHRCIAIWKAPNQCLCCCVCVCSLILYCFYWSIQ